MSENKSRFVLVCQQLLALGTVAALAAPAVGVVSLDIVSPSPSKGSASGRSPAPVAPVLVEQVSPEATEVPFEGVGRAGLAEVRRRGGTGAWTAPPQPHPR
jgi:hypothetical protein